MVLSSDIFESNLLIDREVVFSALFSCRFLGNVYNRKLPKSSIQWGQLTVLNETNRPQFGQKEIFEFGLGLLPQFAHCVLLVSTWGWPQKKQNFADRGSLKFGAGDSSGCERTSLLCRIAPVNVKMVPTPPKSTPANTVGLK